MASVFSCNGVNITLFNSPSVFVARQGWLRRAVSRTLERVGGRWLSVARRLSDIFCSDLHFAFFCCTFAVGKGVRKCFLFLLNSPRQAPQKISLRDPQPPKGGFSNQLWVAVRPQRLSERASLALSSGPSGLLSVAVLQGRSGRVRILMGRMRQMGQLYLVEQMGAGKSRVRLFRNLNRFMTIPSGNPLPACEGRGGRGYSFHPHHSPAKTLFGELYELCECSLRNNSFHPHHSPTKIFFGEWCGLRECRLRNNPFSPPRSANSL